MSGFVFGMEWKVSGGKCKDRADGYIYKYISGIKPGINKGNKVLNTNGAGLQKKIMKKKLSVIV